MNGEVDKFADFDDFPQPAQLALLDLTYNAGVAGIHNKWEKLPPLIKEQNWKKIVEDKQYSRSQVSFERNEVVRKWFKKLLI